MSWMLRVVDASAASSVCAVVVGDCVSCTASTRSATEAPKDSKTPVSSPTHITQGDRALRDKETFSEKFIRKFKRDPLIPIGACLFS